MNVDRNHDNKERMRRSKRMMYSCVGQERGPKRRRVTKRKIKMKGNSKRREEGGGGGEGSWEEGSGSR